MESILFWIIVPLIITVVVGLVGMRIYYTRIKRTK